MLIALPPHSHRHDGRLRWGTVELSLDHPGEDGELVSQERLVDRAGEDNGIDDHASDLLRL